MTTRSLRLPWSARVYTIVVGALLALAATGATATPTSTRLTIEPFMTKGPADAPVTIVEFSDYQ